MIIRLSYLHNGNSFPGRMVSLYWISPQCLHWNILVFLGQYHSYWCLGSLHCQATSNLDIDYAGYNISQEICTRFLLCCGYTLTDFPISIRLTSLALWQSNDCPSASKATLMNVDKYFMWIHYERLHNHNKAKHNKTVCILYCKSVLVYHKKNFSYQHHLSAEKL